MRVDRLAHPLVAGDVVGGRVDHQLVEHGDLLAGERVDHLDALDLVAEELDADGRLLVGGVHLDGVAAHAELAAHEVHVVALVAHVDELPQHAALVDLGAHLEVEHVVAVLLRGAEAVDARHGRDHDHVSSGEQGRGGGVPQPVDLVVHRRVLLDVGVRRGDVGLGLVVVVVGDEVLHAVVREELAELVGELGGERLVRGQHEGGLLHLLDGPADRGALARPGDARGGSGTDRPRWMLSVRAATAVGWSPAGSKSDTIWNGGTVIDATDDS